MDLSVKQVKAARALLGWSQETLSEKSGVPIPTIKRIEAADTDTLPASPNAAKIEKALTKGGAVFIPENGGGAGVRLKK